MNSKYFNLKRFLLTISISIFILIVFLLIFDKLAKFDYLVSNMISCLKNDYLTVFFRYISLMCSKSIIIIICLLIFLFINKHIGIYLGFSSIINYYINHFVKAIVGRTRPLNSLIIEHGFSFPSGHAMASVALYGFLLYIVLKSDINRFLKKAICIFLITLILLIGISRIYLGVHYASDVIAGYCLALFILIIFIDIIEKIERK